MLSALVLALAAESPAKLAETYASAVAEINEKHARSPGKAKEDELARLLPAKARAAFDELLKVKAHEELAAALASAGEAAADLDLEADFESARKALETLDAQAAKQLGVLVSRPRFVVRGLGGLDATYCEHFADVFDAILGAYDELFGFDEYSKVPGKKLRLRVHLEPKIERPPHFAPEFPFHSEIDFPVDDAERLASPTPDGKFLFYGLCHELGHVVAMWGDRSKEEDHHAWAHYTGVAIVEHLSKDKKRAELLEDLKDSRWRSLAKEREAAKDRKPGLSSREDVLALLVALHDEVGPKAIGEALDELDRADKRLRVNRVRYYTFEELKKSLLETVRDEKQRKLVRKLLP